MDDSETPTDRIGFSDKALDALRLGAVLLVVYWCYRIVAPFIPLVLLGAIIAVAIYPMHLRLAKRLGNRTKLSATLMTVLALLVVTTPVVVLSRSLVTTTIELAEDIAEGAVEVPPPPRQIRSWPLVGERLHASWHLASENPAAATERIGPLLLRESVITIRSVARGVLGVAILESILAAIGMVVAGVPAAGLWTFLILILSIVQIPPLLMLIPLNIYAIATGEPLGATVFLVLSVLAVAVDTFVKPVMLGRTADAPMLVILVGAIGGMMLVGFVGLFLGAVLLVLGWEGLNFWVMKGGVADEPPPTDPEQALSSAAQG